MNIVQVLTFKWCQRENIKLWFHKTILVARVIKEFIAQGKTCGILCGKASMYPINPYTFCREFFLRKQNLRHWRPVCKIDKDEVPWHKLSRACFRSPSQLSPGLSLNGVLCHLKVFLEPSWQMAPFDHPLETYRVSGPLPGWGHWWEQQKGCSVLTEGRAMSCRRYNYEGKDKVSLWMLKSTGHNCAFMKGIGLGRKRLGILERQFWGHLRLWQVAGWCPRGEGPLVGG